MFLGGVEGQQLLQGLHAWRACDSDHFSLKLGLVVQHSQTGLSLQTQPGKWSRNNNTL